MSNEVEYKDLIAFHPGSYVAEIIEDSNSTQAIFAKRSDLPIKTLKKIINGEVEINTETANKLAKATGISAQTWLNLQMSYAEKSIVIKNIKNHR